MKTFKWVVEFEIDETWVADGFDLTEDEAQDMIQTRLGWATEDEVKGRIVKAPTDQSIATAQGFKTVAAMRAAR